jgi:hypothetical protein
MEDKVYMFIILSQNRSFWSFLVLVPLLSEIGRCPRAYAMASGQGITKKPIYLEQSVKKRDGTGIIYVETAHADSGASSGI